MKNPESATGGAVAQGDVAKQERPSGPTRVLIVKNSEFDARDWWEAASAAGGTAPSQLWPVLSGKTDRVEVEALELAVIILWASGLPGWQLGEPMGPRHPFWLSL